MSFFTTLQSPGYDFDANRSVSEKLADIREISLKEYSQLESYCSSDKTYEVIAPNDLEYDPKRDNFRDVLPVPSKTALKDPDSKHYSPDNEDYSYYFNANYIDGPVFRYIATQLPIKDNIPRFWEKVFSENVLIIVNLTESNGTDYFPDKNFSTNKYFNKEGFHFSHSKEKKNPLLAFDYSDIEVELTKTTEIGESGNLTVRTFMVRNQETKRERKVFHLHYRGWKDKGTIEKKDYESFSQLFEVFYKIMYGSSRGFKLKMMVHCRAGIGRTGTFIAIDRLIYNLKVLKTNFAKLPPLDILNIVLVLRTQRRKMVENKEQYEFIYKFMFWQIDRQIYQYYPIKFTRGCITFDRDEYCSSDEGYSSQESS